MIDSRLAWLLAVPAVVVGLLMVALGLALGLPIWLVLVLVLVVDVALVWGLYQWSARRVIGALDARVLPAGEHLRLDNMLDAVCVNNGFDRPEVLLVQSAARNSAVIGTGTEVSLVVTEGLLDSVDHMSLEALLAHQLSAAQRDDLDYHTRVAGLLSLLPDGMAARLGDRLLDPAAVFATDIAGARITRYPPGQVSMLETLAQGDNRVGGVSRLSADLWLVNPLGRHDADQSHPPVDDRIAVLREL